MYENMLERSVGGNENETHVVLGWRVGDEGGTVGRENETDKKLEVKREESERDWEDLRDGDQGDMDSDGEGLSGL